VRKRENDAQKGGFKALRALGKRRSLCAEASPFSPINVDKCGKCRLWALKALRTGV